MASRSATRAALCVTLEAATDNGEKGKEGRLSPCKSSARERDTHTHTEASLRTIVRVTASDFFSRKRPHT